MTFLSVTTTQPNSSNGDNTIYSDVELVNKVECNQTEFSGKKVSTPGKLPRVRGRSSMTNRKSPHPPTEADEEMLPLVHVDDRHGDTSLLFDICHYIFYSSHTYHTVSYTLPFSTSLIFAQTRQSLLTGVVSVKGAGKMCTSPEIVSLFIVVLFQLKNVFSLIQF